MRGAAALGLVLLLTACSHNGAQTGAKNAAPGNDKGRAIGDSVASFDPKQIGKSDVDRVADIHRREVFASLRVLAEKLYRRNPREWKKRGTDAILLALREDFGGDRVAVFVAGVGDMLNVAFDEKTEFFMLDELDPQKLYNSARNLEVAAWKLANARDAGGALLLLSNDMTQQPANLSFEREFGKMIGNLDLLAALIADKGHRTIARAAQSLATAVFLPVAGLR